MPAREESENEPRHRNVLLIVADDMGYGDFGVFNETVAETPHLDALVDEGIWFDKVESERRSLPDCADRN